MRAARVALRSHVDAKLAQVEIVPLKVRDLVEPEPRLGREHDQDLDPGFRLRQHQAHLVRGERLEGFALRRSFHLDPAGQGREDLRFMHGVPKCGLQNEPDEQDDAITLLPEAVIEVVSKGYEAKDLEIGPGSISLTA